MTEPSFILSKHLRVVRARLCVTGGIMLLACTGIMAQPVSTEVLTPGGSDAAMAPGPDALRPGDVRKCLVDGQVTYTNGECAAGSEVQAVDTSPAVGASQNAGVRYETVRTVPRMGVSAGPVSDAANCTFLDGEIDRLRAESQASALPEVLRADSRAKLDQVRAKAAALKCGKKG